MALVKCPDCEKMVSPRVTNCPHCGCPAEYFITDDNMKEPKLKEENQKLKQIEFDFGGNKITYPAESEAHARFFGDCLKIAEEAYVTLIQNYQWAGDIKSALRDVSKRANPILDRIINEATQKLYQAGIVITPHSFRAKYANTYFMDLDRYLEIVAEKYAEIMVQKENLKLQREQKINSRGKWQGGGFGIGGAIKGALTAGVMNVGSDILHSVGDNARESRDEKKIENRISRLYSSDDTKELICGGIKTCIMNVYNAYCSEINLASNRGDIINIDSDKAALLYDSTMSYERDSKRLFSNLIQAIALYPGERRYYEIIETELGKYESELERFIQYWNIHFLFEKLAVNKDGREIFLQTKAEADLKNGVLSLVKGQLVFEAEGMDTIKIDIDKIKKVEPAAGYQRGVTLSVKGRFLLYIFYTEEEALWMDAIEDARKGIYRQRSANSESKTNAMKEEENKSVEEYIQNHIDEMSYAEAIKYYMKCTNVDLREGRNKVEEIYKRMGKLH